MKRDGHENVAFFVGPEVEHTPAYSKKTLFVVGKQNLDTIVERAREHKTPHIYMGANHSFEVDPTDNTFYWDKTITGLLDRGFWVTLDYPAHQHNSVLLILNKGVWQSRIFVPMLRVCIPKIQESSPNLTVKIDDIDFKATNPGVWCLNFHELMDSNRFTDWNEYATDLVIETDDKPTPMPPYINPGPTGWGGSLKVKTFPNDVAPRLDLSKFEKEALKDPDVLEGFQNYDIKNDGSLGLDPTGKSKLKDDPTEVLESLTLSTPLDAAAAYAEGAKEDPLGKEGSKKKVKK
jgi:hypothetical protein